MIKIYEKQSNFDFPMPIETPRLLLRPPQIGEGQILNETILESFDTLNKFMHWANEKPSLETSEEVVRKAAANWILKKDEDPNLMLFIFDKSTNQLVGATGYHHIDWEKPSVETGYWVRSQFAGKGFITEAVNALTQYAFKQIGVKKITITCDHDNIRSKNIPEKLGFKLESILKANRKKPVTGEASDTLVYVRTDLNGIPELNVTWGSTANNNKINSRD